MRELDFSDGFSSETAPDIGAIVEVDSIDGSEILLENDQNLRSKNAANTANLNLLKANTSNEAVLGTITNHDFVPTSGTHLANKNYVDTKENPVNKGQPNGYAPLNASSKIDSTYLPSYVDDVLEYADFASFPATGETGKIYIALDTNKTYRWSGSVYIEISSSEVNSVAGKTGNVTLVKADVGLSNVDNTSDATKNSAVATLTNKTITGASIQGPILLDAKKDTLANLTTYAATATNGELCYATDTKAYYGIKDGALTPLGGGTGQGGINYILNSTFEDNINGYATYADAAAASPVDGTGGTANVTIARTTSTPLRSAASLLFTKDAVNRQGQGFSATSFTIDRTDQGKVLQIKFDYQIMSGTYTSGDVTVWILDLINNRLIQPAPSTIQSSGITETFVSEFQTASNSNIYRLIFHVSTTSALAYTMMFDNVQVGPNPKTYGSVITDWVSYTPTGSWSTNTTYSGRYRRNGDSINLQINIELTGAPNSVDLTFTSAQLLNGLGLFVDAAKIAGNGGTQDLTTIGVGSYSDQGTANRGGLTVVWEKISSLVKIPGPTFSDPNATSPITWANGDNLSLNLTVPIQGWSTTQQLSSDADTRVITGRVNRSATQSIPNASVTKVQFDSVLFDRVSGWDNTNYRYIAKVAGDYEVYSQLQYANNTTGIRGVRIFKNGVEFVSSQSQPISTGNSSQANVKDIVPLNAGDYVEIFAYQESGGSLSINAGVNTYISIQRISGPSQIAASETVSLKYTNSSGTTITSTSSDLIFPNKVFDSHNAYNTSNGIFTAPISGEYQVYSHLVINNITLPSNNAFVVAIFKGATLTQRSFTMGNGATNNLYAVQVMSTIKLLQGETIKIQSASDVSGVLSTNAYYNTLEIKRIGNY